MSLSAFLNTQILWWFKFSNLIVSSTDSLSTQTNLDGMIHDTILKRFYRLISCLFCSSKDSYAEEMRRSSGGYTGTGYGGRREGRSYSSSDSLDDLGVYNCCAWICMAYKELLYCSSYDNHHIVLCLGTSIKVGMPRTFHFGSVFQHYIFT